MRAGMSRLDLNRQVAKRARGVIALRSGAI